MTNKTFAAVANYRAKQLKELTDYLPVNAGDVGAIVDRQAFTDATTACRDDAWHAYQEVFGDLADEELLRESWAVEDTPAVTLVASKPITGPADPSLVDDDPELTARVNKVMGKAAVLFPEDVPGVDGPPASAPSEGTVPGPVGAPPSASPQTGPGTPDDSGEDDDNALD